MKIEYGDIILRDSTEQDIEDEIRWNTVETQWALWDAPWEMEEELPKFNPEAYRKTELARLSQPKPDPRTCLEVDTADGIHIGSVASYFVDENYDWIVRSAIRPGQLFFRTLGLDISESRFWGRGLGRQALTAWISYFLEHGEKDLYLQTWSGNIRMIRLAGRLGFTVCQRREKARLVRGGTYDGLTFRLNPDEFQPCPLKETPNNQ